MSGVLLLTLGRLLFASKPRVASSDALCDAFEKKVRHDDDRSSRQRRLSQARSRRKGLRD